MYYFGVLQRVLASRLVRAGLLAVILSFCGYGLATAWPQVWPTLSRLHIYSLAGSLAAALAGSGCMMLAWRAVLADLGSPLPAQLAARVTFVSQLGKYLPGAVWSFAAHVELGHHYQVPRPRGAASVVASVAIAIAAGLLIATAGLPFASPAMAHRYWPVLAAVPFISVCLLPPVLHRLLNVGLRIIRQEPLEHPVSWRGFGVVIGWTLLGWLMFGLQAWLLLSGVSGNGADSLLLAIGAYAFATSMALALVVFPNGIGARELLFVAALAPALPSGPALAVALAARVVTIASDLTWGAVGLALGSRSRSMASAEQQGRRERGRHRKPASRRLPARG